MVSKAKWLYLSVLALMAAILGLVHHYFVTGGIWWQWTDFWHHEPLIAMCFVCSLSLIAGYLLRSKE